MSENRWGTVFMGPTSDKESRLDKINNREEQDLWNRRTEAEYLRRVKERAVEQLNAMLEEAQEQAAGLLAAANADADAIRAKAEVVLDEARQDRTAAADELAEATRIREEALEEGYGRGVEQAMLELEEQREKIDATTLSVLKAMESQCSGLFDSWREELAALVRQSVETGLGWTLKEDRAEVLEGLLGKALDALENHRRIVVRANPEDAPAVEEVLAGVRHRFNELQAWDIQPDETLAPGGLVVESVSGKVESRAEARKEIVERALRHLTIPRSEADDIAEAAVQKAADESGVPALEQSVQEAGQRALERAGVSALLEAAEAERKTLEIAAEAEKQAEEQAVQAEKDAIVAALAAQETVQPEQPAVSLKKAIKALPGAETEDMVQVADAAMLDEEPALNEPKADSVAGEEFADVSVEEPADLSGEDTLGEDNLTPEAAMALDIPPELADLLASNPDDDPDGEEFDKMMQENASRARKVEEA